MPDLHIRPSPPDDAVIMLRAGMNGLKVSKVTTDAQKSLALLGLLGISVAASLPGEDLTDAWTNARVANDRNIIWWSTAGGIRAASFPILATGSDARHHTIVLAHLEEPLLRAVASVFRREER